MGNIFEKGDASLGKTKMTYNVKSYLESLKYQKGIRVLHDFLVASITSLHEVSVKSARQ
ncbi:hypothetical protein TSL6_16860 [Sulfurovum sp. TSL6]|uniref:hypothetical protein n=1 Tax=Sulfurovum sp. TSL6 TaxID=2826995 RepID=UPI001CC54D30|nr:hypothetical protein [Sulfurovum sp. TSL6]GIU01180.1 hypothetical protein TSL6_16860 [Sulfurovum sp. TSL6]